MADIGVRWIRLGVEWAVIEPQRGQFRWDAVDRVIEEADSVLPVGAGDGRDHPAVGP